MNETAARLLDAVARDPEDEERWWAALAEEARSGIANAHCAPLYRLSCWSVAPEAVQDHTIAAVAKGLGADYQDIGARTFRCEELSFRLGRFIHQRCGVVLHLLPGDDANAPLLMGAFVVAAHEWHSADLDLLLDDEIGSWPQVLVSFHEAREWLARAGGELRLPGEKEWEHACRGGATTPFPWGERPDLDRTWCRENAAGVHPESYHSGSGNAFGLVDMLGNVWEWTASFPTSDYAPRAPHLTVARILKGGSFLCPAERCRVDTRDMGRLYQADDQTGFRVCRSLPDL